MSAQSETLSVRPSSAAGSRLIRRTIQVSCFSIGGFLIFAAFGASQRTPNTYGTPPPTPTALSEPIAPIDESSPLDEPLRLIGEAHGVFSAVKDYSCTLIKKERVNGQLTPDHVIELKVRCQPFGVYMHFLDPKDLAGQEVCYASDKHGNKMRVHSNGGLSLLGWITLDQKDPRALKTSRHTISEAGLGNLINRYVAAWETERSLGVTKVHIAEYEYDKHRCTRVETTYTGDVASRFEYYRTVVYFDRDSKLPIRVECYDYPRQEGDTGELLESFSYVNLRLNVGVSEETFKH